MPRPDPLRALLVLRRMETQAATLRLAEAGLARARTAAAQQESANVLQAESGLAAGESFAAWLPRARAAAGHAAAALAVAEAGAAQARAAAAAAGLAEKATQAELRRQQGLRRAARLARLQHELDDIASGCDAPP